jgi:peptidoglycan/xylan/chitin deacetylase (PgdA/CDA1 family)
MAASGRAREGIRVLTYHLLPAPEVFSAQIEAIRSVADIIDEDELLEALANRQASPAHRCRVVLTFDDGYRQHLTGSALDLVAGLGLRPTVFMVAAALREESCATVGRLVKEQRSASRPLVNASELRRAVQAGWFVGSHTSTHWDCATGGRDELLREITGSKAMLEECLQRQVRTFAFPFGRPRNISLEARQIVEQSGYRAAFTTCRGVISTDVESPFLLPRDVVESWWGPAEVRGCLTGVLDRFGGSA